MGSAAGTRKVIMNHRGRQAFETEFMATLGRAVIFKRIDVLITDAAFTRGRRMCGHTRYCAGFIDIVGPFLEKGIEWSIDGQLGVFLVRVAPQATSRFGMGQLVGLIDGEATGAGSEGNKARHFALICGVALEISGKQKSIFYAKNISI